MRWNEAPAAPCALAALGGLLLAPHLSYLPLLPTACLAALGMAWGGRRGWLLLWLCLGLIVAYLDLQRQSTSVDGRRPVEALVRLVDHPRTEQGRSWARAEVLRLRQGRSVHLPAWTIAVQLPEECGPLGLGQHWRLRGYVRRASGYANQGPPRAGLRRLWVKSCRLATLEQDSHWLGGLATELRQRVERAWGNLEPGPGPALIRALALGDPGQLPIAWQQALRRSGLAHLLAVSGLHVGLLAAMCLAATTPFPRPLRLVSAILCAGLYLLLLGPRPSALRAALMAFVALGALAVQRPPAPHNGLALATLVLLGGEPGRWQDLGLRLSIVATAGILCLAPTLSQRWSGLPRPVALSLAASVAAQVAVLPIVVPSFGGLSMLSPLLNLVAVPWLALSLATAFAWLGLVLVQLPGQETVASAAAWLALPLQALSELPASSGLFLTVSGTGMQTAFVSLWLIGCLGLLGQRPRWLALALAVLSVQGAGPAQQRPELRMLDVGQGEALLLRDRGRTMLLDGGGWHRGDFGGRVLLPALARAGVRRLDLAVLSHADTDHCAGLADLVRYLPVRQVWTSARVRETPCGRRLLAAPGPEHRVLRRGDRWRLGRFQFRVLSAGEPEGSARFRPGARAGQGSPDHSNADRRNPVRGRPVPSNEASLVLTADIAGRRLLLTGDIGRRRESLLVRRRLVGPTFLLKVAHHGSRSSSSAPFLAAVQPRLALISAGRGNAYGHPAQEVLARLRPSGATVLRTDQLGQIQVLFGPGRRVRLSFPSRPIAPMP